MAELEIGYRRVAFTPVSAWRRWWPLAQREFAALFAYRWGVALFALCLLPAVGRLILLLIVNGMIRLGPGNGQIPGGGRRGQEFARDPKYVEFYFDHVLQVLPGMVFFLLLATLVVARAVAKDRTTNALELYWTRCISPRAYVLAKWVGTTLLVGSITVGAPVVLWLTAVLLAEDWTVLQVTAWPLFTTVVGMTLVTAAWTGIGVAISAAAASPNAAMVGFAALLVGSQAVGRVLGRIAHAPEWSSWLSLWDAGTAVVRGCGGIPQRHADPLGGAVLLTTLLVLLAWRARGRLSAVEAVA